MRFDRHTLGRVGKIVQSVFDQAWLSGINFAISLLLIRELDKSEYGLYVLLLNTVLLFQGVGGALLSSPFTTLLPQKPAEARPLVIRVFSVMTLLYGVVAALVGFGGLLIYRGWSDDLLISLSTGLAFAACVFGSLYRDNIRVLYYALGEPGQALRNNVLYGMLLLVALALSVWREHLSATAVLAIIGTTGTIVSGALIQPILDSLARVNRTDWHADSASRACVREFWTCGRWALLGALMTFVASNTHPYFAAMSFTKSDVADLSASRLLTVPIALVGTAWSNMARPLVSRWAHEGQQSRLDAVIRQSLLIALLLTVGLGVLLWAFSDFIPRLFGEKYAALLTMSLLWTAYTGATFIKGIFGATLMTSDTGYRRLSRIAAINMVAMFVVMALAGWSGRAEAIIVALTVLEGLQIALMARSRHEQENVPCPA
jgi:O-antigen/teichoic acid export membrane protein